MGVNPQTPADSSQSSDPATAAARRTTAGGLGAWARTRSLTPVFFEGVGVRPDLLPRLAQAAGLECPAQVGNSPRHADVMIIAGPVPIRLMPAVHRIWKSMRSPRWCVAFGGGAGHPVDSYALVDDITRFMPVDVHIPECPPTLESMREAVRRVHELAATGVAS